MDLRKRLGVRLHRALLYWGLRDHPRGRDRAQERYTPFGGVREQEWADENDDPRE
jgi:hypothetical protein